MNFKDAQKLAKAWPNWIQESKKVAIKLLDNDEILEEHKEWFLNTYDFAIEKAGWHIPIIQWFLNCLYRAGYKIVPK